MHKFQFGCLLESRNIWKAKYGDGAEDAAKFLVITGRWLIILCEYETGSFI